MNNIVPVITNLMITVRVLGAVDLSEAIIYVM